MKIAGMKIVAILLLALPACAADWAVYPDGRHSPVWPATINWPDGRETCGATPEQATAAGLARPETSEERIARETADAEREAAAAAERAALAGPAPETFIPILDGSGELVGTARLVAQAGTMAVYALTNSASPQKVWAIQKTEFTKRATVSSAKLASAKSKGAAANSVPALREALADLIAAVESGK